MLARADPSNERRSRGPFPRMPIAAALALAAICSSLLLVRNTDLGIYWHGVNGFFSGIRSAYGPDSGVGHPLEYRYPPVTYLILWPLRFFSLRVAGFLWMLGAWIAAIATVLAAIRIRGLRFSPAAALVCSALALPYIVLAIRYGNVQPFVISAIFSTLILSETRPGWAGLLLALSISFKIWPILFLPWLIRRVRIRAAACSLLWLLILWIAPAAFFGPRRYVSLIGQWISAMRQVGSYTDTYYFLGESLREVLLRLLTPFTPTATDLRSVHVLALSPFTASMIWAVLAAAIYAGCAVAMLRSDARQMWAWDGVGFILYSIIEPYAVRSGLISLAPAMLTAACLYTLSEECAASRSFPASLARRLAAWAGVVALLGTIIQYRPWHRFLLAVGIDFWAELLLLAAMLIWLVRTDPACSLLSRRSESAPA